MQSLQLLNRQSSGTAQFGGENSAPIIQQQANKMTPDKPKYVSCYVFVHCVETKKTNGKLADRLRNGLIVSVRAGNRNKTKLESN